MSKFRWLIALLCVFSLVAAACGDDDDDGAAAGDDSAASSDDDGGDDSAASSDDDGGDDDGTAPSDDGGDDGAAAGTCGANTPDDTPGIDKEAGTITIGTSQPFTGRAAVAGEGLLGGIQLAVDEVNANGGIDGCTFVLVWEDDRFEIEQMVTNVRKMIEEDGVWGFVGTAGSQAIPSTYPAIEGAGTPLWGPVSPADQDIQQVYLTTATRTEQGRICIDYFAEQGVTQVAAIGQDNELGVEAFAAIDTQAPVHGMEIVAKEEVEVLSDNVAAAVLSVIDSEAGGVLTAVDNAQNGLILDQFHEAGFEALVCSDSGAAGSGGQNTVSLANPDAADGFIGALQVALPESDDPFVVAWSELWDAYDGPGKEGGAPNFSLQNYSNTRAFLELMDRLDGDYSYDNFHAVTEALVDDPILIPSIPPIACGPLPGGHSCAAGAGLSQYDAASESWSQIRDFQSPAE